MGFASATWGCDRRNMTRFRSRGQGKSATWARSSILIQAVVSPHCDSTTFVSARARTVTSMTRSTCHSNRVRPSLRRASIGADPFAHELGRLRAVCTTADNRLRDVVSHLDRPVAPRRPLRSHLLLDQTSRPAVARLDTTHSWPGTQLRVHARSRLPVDQLRPVKLSRGLSSPPRSVRQRAGAGAG